MAVPSKSSANKHCKLRKSITPGTVLILLAGRHKGKRVIFLKQLDSGSLLVTGPYKFNGVPLKKVNQAYVIATSTKIDISQVQLPENINDLLFAKKSETKKFIEESNKTSSLDKSHNPSTVILNAQAQVDKQLIPLIKKQQLLRSYLGSYFSLKKGQTPHNMVF